MQSVLKGYTVTQIGFVVKDIDAAAQAFTKLTGMSVAATMDTADIDTSSWKYLGKDFVGRNRSLAFRFNNIELEYIQPDPGNNAWRDFLDEHGEGIHHIAFKVKDIHHIADEMTKQGYEMVQCGEFDGGRFAYFNTVDGIKTTVELLEFD